MNNRVPNAESLRKLYEALPDFVQQADDKRALAGLPSLKKALPKNLCDVCGRGYNRSFLVTSGSLPEMSGQCERCTVMLKDGCIALVSGNNFAFVKPGGNTDLADMVGKVQKVSTDTMKAVEQHFKTEWMTKEQPPAPESPESPGTSPRA